MQKNRKFKYLVKIGGINKLTGDTVEIMLFVKHLSEIWQTLNCEYRNVQYVSHSIKNL